MYVSLERNIRHHIHSLNVIIHVGDTPPPSTLFIVSKIRKIRTCKINILLLLLLFLVSGARGKNKSPAYSVGATSGYRRLDRVAPPDNAGREVTHKLNN